MDRRKRPNRTSDMDDALFEALKSGVPAKDTGPEPEDILDGLFEDEGGDVSVLDPDPVADPAELSIRLEPADRDRLREIVDYVREQTGKKIEAAEAVRLALCVCQPGKGLLEILKKQDV